MWLLVKFAWPAHLEREIEEREPEEDAAPVIPAIVVFIYLAVVLYIGIFAFPSREGK